MKPAEFGIVRVNRLHAALVEPQIAQIDDAQDHFGNNKRAQENQKVGRDRAQPAAPPLLLPSRHNPPQFRRHAPSLSPPNALKLQSKPTVAHLTKD